jgi:hypothetical protein
MGHDQGRTDRRTGGANVGFWRSFTDQTVLALQRDPYGWMGQRVCRQYDAGHCFQVGCHRNSVASFDIEQMGMQLNWPR